MKLKKNTDVYDIEMEDFATTVAVDSYEGRKLTEILETLCGSPALDDHKSYEPQDTITIKRFRLKKALTLKASS